MGTSPDSSVDLSQLLGQIKTLHRSLGVIDSEGRTPAKIKAFVDQSGTLIEELRRAREELSPIRFGQIGISLGRSDGIAKFFAFSFVSQEKRDLSGLFDSPFFGSGVYAVYYHGESEKSYLPLSGTETPIYVGKADPKDPNAETAEVQGTAIFSRLREHARNIEKTELKLEDFRYRASPIQSGMQGAVEDFMIRLFRPIWNKEIKICFGIGKHGDSAATRGNKRSPWDTMHPGRKWAADTTEDQMKRSEIVSKIASHFKEHPVVPDRDVLFRMLSLE